MQADFDLDYGIVELVGPAGGLTLNFPRTIHVSQILDHLGPPAAEGVNTMDGVPLMITIEELERPAGATGGDLKWVLAGGVNSGSPGVLAATQVLAANPVQDWNPLGTKEVGRIVLSKYVLTRASWTRLGVVCDAATLGTFTAGKFRARVGTMGGPGFVQSPAGLR